MNKCKDPAPTKDDWQLWWPLFYKYETDPFVIRIQSMNDPSQYLYITKVLDQEKLGIGKLDEQQDAS